MRHLLLLACACLAVAVHAQVNIESIKRDPQYICGHGHGRSTRMADQEALRQISSQIWTYISDSTTSKAKIELDSEGRLSEAERHEIFTKTFTAGAIPNSHMIELSPEPDAEIFRYVHKDDITLMFKKKGERILDLVNAGKKAEQRLQIDDALRNYYWALLLASSHTEPVYCEFDGKKGECLSELPQKIKSVLLRIKAELTDCEEIDGKYLVRMRFTYAGHDVASLQIKYHDGMSMIGPLNVRDGMGELDMLRLPDNDKIMLQYIYNFEEEAEHLSEELKAVYAYTKDLPIINSRADVGVKVNAKKGTMRAAKTGKNDAASETASIAAEEIRTPRKLINMPETDAVNLYIPAMQAVESAIKAQNPELAKNYFTDEGYEMLETLLKKTGKVTLAGNAPEYKFIEAPNQILGRSCHIKLRLPNGKTFMENLVMRFNPISHKVQSIAFALTKKAEADIFNSASPWGEISRYTILQFMEDYQTAFALKRADYIEQLFSDQAIIITGSVLSKSPDKGAFDGVAVKLNNSEKVKYRQFTKEQYIDRLKQKFKDHYVHLTFEDNTTGMVNTNGILPRDAAFAIQIRQLYTCTDGYADRGYLTLFLNMQGKHPLIEVRLWQPEDDVMPYEEFLQKFHVK